MRRKPKLLSIERLRRIRNILPPIQEKVSGVYFLFDDDRLVYIGKSTCFYSRISGHFSIKKFNGVSFLEYEQSNISSMESSYISKYKPPLNKQRGKCSDPNKYQINAKLKQKLYESLRLSIENRKKIEGSSFGITDFIEEAAQEFIKKWSKAQ